MQAPECEVPSAAVRNSTLLGEATVVFTMHPHFRSHQGGMQVTCVSAACIVSHLRLPVCRDVLLQALLLAMPDDYLAVHWEAL